MSNTIQQFAHGVLVSASNVNVQYTEPLPSFNPAISELPENPMVNVDASKSGFNSDGMSSLPGQIPAGTGLADDGKDTKDVKGDGKAPEDGSDSTGTVSDAPAADAPAADAPAADAPAATTAAKKTTTK